MNHLDAFRGLPASLSLDEKLELYRLFVANPEQGVLKVMELAAIHGLNLSVTIVFLLSFLTDFHLPIPTFFAMLLVFFM